MIEPRFGVDGSHLYNEACMEGKMMMQRRFLRRWWPAALCGLFALPLLLLIGRSAPQPLRAQGATTQEVIYIDPNGIIQAIQLNLPPAQNNYSVLWFSPPADGGWRDAASGDFNGDGDDEIVAVRDFVTNTFNLAIYDPVIAPGTDVGPDDVQFFGSTPWRTLYTATIPGDLRLVAAGDFNLSRGGDEIFYSYRTTYEDGVTAAAEQHRIQIIQRTATDRGGTQWEELTGALGRSIVWETVV
jgi:hypothetical protein